ncbi:MAG: hypothetical protein LBS73_03650 [Campylobacteraceae bacterium]|jgi:hypothetical protein|nr:hypothetical protein [Campylobacteraceae bacterium]
MTSKKRETGIFDCLNVAFALFWSYQFLQTGLFPQSDRESIFMVFFLCAELMCIILALWLNTVLYTFAEYKAMLKTKGDIVWFVIVATFVIAFLAMAGGFFFEINDLSDNNFFIILYILLLFSRIFSALFADYGDMSRDAYMQMRDKELHIKMMILGAVLLVGVIPMLFEIDGFGNFFTFMFTGCVYFFILSVYDTYGIIKILRERRNG